MLDLCVRVCTNNFIVGCQNVSSLQLSRIMDSNMRWVQSISDDNFTLTMTA